MSENEFRHKINLINETNSVALIDAGRIKLLIKTANSYEMLPVNIEGLSHIPIIVRTKKTENSPVVAYTLEYELLVPHTNLPSIYNEKYSLSEGSQIICSRTINDSTKKTPVIYDNKGIVTISKIISTETLESYITKNKRKLFELKHLIDASNQTANELNSQKTLTL